MKDSIGSTLLLKIFTVFLVVYIIFMASILNYTKTFRVKNQIINIINRHGGYTDEAKNEINNYFSKSTIYGSCTELSGTVKFGEDESNRCEIKAYSMESPVSGSYYKVRLYVTFMFPLIKQTLRIPITGETKILYKLAPPGSQEAQYTIVDRDPPPDTLYKFDIKTVTCGGGSSVPGKACCSQRVCSSGLTYKKVAGQCGCYDSSDVRKGDPQLNRSAPGRIPTSDLCYYCLAGYEGGSCNKRDLSYIRAVGPSTSAPYLQTRKIEIYLNDVDRLGIKSCSANVTPVSVNISDTSSSTVYVTFTFDACKIGRDVENVTISCVDAKNKTVDLGSAATRTVRIKKPEKCCNVDNCKNCEYNDYNKCKTCDDGYYKSSGTCKSCTPGCAKCSDAWTCDTCADGTYKSGKKCYACLTGCKICTNGLICDTCNSGYTKKNNICVKNCTVTYCSTYEQTATSCKCTGCMNNRVLSKSGSKCCSSISNCSTYSDTDCTCSQCKNGYVKKADGSCEPRGGGGNNNNPK